ncbi:hypothetical protein OC834_005047 [Tilletia horrida]|uniref:ABM domain-containing protein n=1 Tax=Tilletia horrida TaxID=155126 RepID=A0AAN6JIX1_9BASI|nr:hypothetical protein OC842_005516 [Tilletia horrida]KAK0525738.1 hypothetical protein OC834_005047 [Tilletia horrida]KAK0531689.1 hypothetical protein OC835_003589 [Tilletia horrida]KAK0559404.1 hypothetical protein OC844_004435 [Tilletia horrida]
MTVLELAILRLKEVVPSVTPTQHVQQADAIPQAQPQSALTFSLRAELSHALTTLQEAHDEPFVYYRELEDPSLLYLMGNWPSLAAHMDAFIPGEANQELLRRLANHVEIVDFQHLDNVRIQDTPLDWGKGEDKDPGAGEVVAVSRLWVKKEEREAFDELGRRNLKLLATYASPRRVVEAWRIEPEEPERYPGTKQSITLTGWDSIEHHYTWPKQPEFAEFSSERRSKLAGFEVRHIVKLEL